MYVDPKYGIVAPDAGTSLDELGGQLVQMIQSFSAALASFDYNGADPNLVLAQVAALEAAMTRREKSARGSGSISAIATGTRLTELAIPFPAGRFDAAPTVVMQYTGGPSNAPNLVIQPTAVTKDGFTARVYNSHASATLTATFNWIAVGA